MMKSGNGHEASGATRPVQIRNKFLREDVTKASILLARKIEKHDGTACEYTENWNDERVAQEVGGSATAAHVRDIRRANFGRTAEELKNPRAGGYRKDSRTRRIEALEARVAVLEELLTKPRLM